MGSSSWGKLICSSVSPTIWFGALPVCFSTPDETQLTRPSASLSHSQSLLDKPATRTRSVCMRQRHSLSWVSSRELASWAKSRKLARSSSLNVCSTQSVAHSSPTMRSLTTIRAATLRLSVNTSCAPGSSMAPISPTDDSGRTLCASPTSAFTHRLSSWLCKPSHAMGQPSCRDTRRTKASNCCVSGAAPSLRNSRSMRRCSASSGTGVIGGLQHAKDCSGECPSAYPCAPPQSDNSCTHCPGL